jgi:DNA-binding CsgD family transcriptional regulator
MKIIAEVIDKGQLTAQEAVVLRHLCEGKMRREIAFSVHRSYGCVSKHVESIAAKLNARSAAEIVSVAVAKGMVKIRIEHTDHRTALLKCLIIAMLINPHILDLRQPPRHCRQSVKLLRTRSETQFVRSQP